MLLMGEEIVETGARRQGSRKPLDISIWERRDKSSNRVDFFGFIFEMEYAYTFYCWQQLVHSKPF